MRWNTSLICSVFVVTVGGLMATPTQAQNGDCLSCGDNVNFSGGSQMNGLAAGDGFVQEQLYPYDQQDPWLHGQYQRVPSYGGYNSFRPHNYRHIVPQAQIAANWGATEGLSYSHQFYNRYRRNFLDGGVHSKRVQQAPPSYVILPSATDAAVMRSFSPASNARQLPQYRNAAAASTQQYQRR